MEILLWSRPMSTTAGSNPRAASSGAKKRRNIHGYTVTVTDDIFRLLQRLAPTTMSTLFRQARDQGAAHLQLEGIGYRIHRHPDHTFAVELLDARQHPLL